MRKGDRELIFGCCGAVLLLFTDRQVLEKNISTLTVVCIIRAEDPHANLHVALY